MRNTNDESSNAPTRSYLKDLLSFPQLSDPQQFNRLHAEWKRTGSQRIYNQLLYGCTRIVFWTVRVYSNPWYDAEMMDDLMQEGFIGVGKGIQDYDPGYQVHFFTYVHWKIRAEVTRFRQNNHADRQVRLPVHLLEKSRMIEAQRARYMQLHGHGPDDEELFSWIHRFDDSEDGTKLARSIRPTDLETHALHKGQRTIHLDQEIPGGGDEGGDKTHSEVIGGANHDHEALILGKRLLAEYVSALKRVDEHIDALCAAHIIDERASKVTHLRFGFGVRRLLTFDELKKQYGCSRQNIEQVEKTTIKKICRGINLTPELLLWLIGTIAALAEYLDDTNARALVASNIRERPNLSIEARNVDELIMQARCIGARGGATVRRPALYRIKSKPREFTFLRTISQYFTLSYAVIMKNALKQQQPNNTKTTQLRVSSVIVFPPAL
jgi:RNA polymerase sigma factor (sigma-70 family)